MFRAKDSGPEEDQIRARMVLTKGRESLLVRGIVDVHRSCGFGWWWQCDGLDPLKGDRAASLLLSGGGEYVTCRNDEYGLRRLRRGRRAVRNIAQNAGSGGQDNRRGCVFFLSAEGCRHGQDGQQREGESFHSSDPRDMPSQCLRSMFKSKIYQLQTRDDLEIVIFDA